MLLGDHADTYARYLCAIPMRDTYARYLAQRIVPRVPDGKVEKVIRSIDALSIARLQIVKRVSNPLRLEG